MKEKGLLEEYSSSTNTVSFIDTDRDATQSTPFTFTSEISQEANGKNTSDLDMTSVDKEANFFQNLKYWNQETQFSSVNVLNNTHFIEIVEMGLDAVPFILEELKKGTTPLVYALDRIFPGVVNYNGFVTLKAACDKWRSILLQTD